MPEINENTLSYIAEHNSNPLDFMYAIMKEEKLSNTEALGYLLESFGHKYDEEELKAVIKQYNKETKKNEEHDR